MSELMTEPMTEIVVRMDPDSETEMMVRALDAQAEAVKMARALLIERDRLRKEVQELRRRLKGGRR